jgi:hypothetical protein
MNTSIHVDDLIPEQRKQLGVRMPRQTDFTKEEMRSWALKVLAGMAGLSRRSMAEDVLGAVARRGRGSKSRRKLSG